MDLQQEAHVSSMFSLIITHPVHLLHQICVFNPRDIDTLQNVPLLVNFGQTLKYTMIYKC